MLYAPDGTITGVRQHWSFDDMFSAFATQGLESKEKGKFTREELAPLAKVNVELLKEYDYFTYVTVDGIKVPIDDPLPDYSLDFDDPGADPEFHPAAEEPVKAKAPQDRYLRSDHLRRFRVRQEGSGDDVGAPAGCKLQTELPREMTYAEGKALSEIPADQPNVTMALGRHSPTRSW